MSQQVKGVVTKVHKQEGNGKRGPWTKVSFVVNGSYYGGFLNKKNEGNILKVKEGDTVDISYTSDGKFNTWDVVTVLEAAASNVVPFNDNLDKVKALQPYNPGDKDYRITYLASRRDAIELVKSLIEVAAIKLPAKQADQADVFLDYVRKYADIFAADAMSAKLTNDEPTVNTRQTYIAKETVQVE